MDNAFFEALNSLGSENGLDTDTLIEKVKSAMLKAARKAYPDSEDRITVEIDPTTKTFEMYLRQDVIDDEPIDENEINIAEARNIDPSIKVGDHIQKRLDINRFGRAAARGQKSSVTVRGSRLPSRRRTSGAAADRASSRSIRLWPFLKSWPQEEISMPVSTISR